MLFVPGRIAGSLLVLYGPGMLVGEPGVLFSHVECMETWEQSLEDALYLCAWDEPCSCSISWRFLVEELILYVELLGVAGFCVKYWKHSWI